MATIITGIAFGVSLVASGVYQPSVILSQLNLQNWHMIQAFLTATASSAILVSIAQRTAYVQFKPRSFSSLGLFARYDANIVGGILLGHGMALSGACPGTVLSQVALGIRSGYDALAGATLGGIVWTGFLQPYLSRRPKSPVPPNEKLTIHEVLGLSRTAVVVGFDAVLAAIVVATVAFTTPGPEAKISPVLGGLLIGSAQLLSLLLRKSLLGVSTSYEEVGEWFWSIVGAKGLRSYNSILFSLGIIGGSWSVAHLFPELAQVVDVKVNPLSAGLGGFLMVVGSRMAGGCTSGHGVSGMSLLSISSVITIGVAFTWGVLVSKAL